MNTRKTTARTSPSGLRLRLLRIEEGHWEGDTVVGKKAGKQAIVLSLLEKKTENDITLQIPGKDANSVPVSPKSQVI